MTDHKLDRSAEHDLLEIQPYHHLQRNLQQTEQRLQLLQFQFQHGQAQSHFSLSQMQLELVLQVNDGISHFLQSRLNHNLAQMLVLGLSHQTMQDPLSSLQEQLKSSLHDHQGSVQLVQQLP